jgi:uncharacterized membrane protein YgcG
LGTPDDPIDNLDVDAALSHWAEGTGDDVYVDMRSHLSTGGGSVFTAERFAEALANRVVEEGLSGTVRLESNSAKASATGDTRVAISHDYYVTEGRFASDPHSIPNSFFWGVTSATIKGEMVVVSNKTTTTTVSGNTVKTTLTVISVRGEIRAPQEDFDFDVHTWNPLESVSKKAGALYTALQAGGIGTGFDIKFAGSGVPVSGTYVVITRTITDPDGRATRSGASVPKTTEETKVIRVDMSPDDPRFSAKVTQIVFDNDGDPNTYIDRILRQQAGYEDGVSGSGTGGGGRLGSEGGDLRREGAGGGRPSGDSAADKAADRAGSGGGGSDSGRVNGGDSSSGGHSSTVTGKTTSQTTYKSGGQTHTATHVGLARLLWRAFSSLPGLFARRRWGSGSRAMNAA